MHQPQQRMNNRRSVTHAHEFDRMDMRGETPAYEAGGGQGRGEGVPAHPRPRHGPGVRESFPDRAPAPRSEPVTIPALSAVA